MGRGGGGFKVRGVLCLPAPRAGTDKGLRRGDLKVDYGLI